MQSHSDSSNRSTLATYLNKTVWWMYDPSTRIEDAGPLIGGHQFPAPSCHVFACFRVSDDQSGSQVAAAGSQSFAEASYASLILDKSVML